MRKGFLLTVAVLIIVIGFLFRQSFVDGETLFSNDSPLGALTAKSLHLPEGFFGYWQDLYWVGGQAPSAVPSFSFLWYWLLEGVGFSKTYAPVSIFLMGICAAFCFARMGFGKMACVLGGLAAALNMNAFSNACWGLGSRPIVFAMNFLTVAALYSHRQKPHWAKPPLAGLAVGLAILDGYDIGAIFSLYIAAFGMFMAWTEAGDPAKRIIRGAMRVAAVAFFAAFIAASALITLVETQIKGTTTAEDGGMSREEKWIFNTQWSLPKAETLRVLIPGLYGYGMPAMYNIPVTEYKGLEYWGKVGQRPGQVQERLSGAGEYAGVLVVLLAAFTIAQAIRRDKGLFDPFERRCIWFWSGAALVSLLFAYGRFAPFYQVIYQLPFFNNIRNPIKFTHPLHLSLLILFGYGVQAVYRKYLAGPESKSPNAIAHFKKWWAESQGFEKKWTISCIALTVASFVGWLMYSNQRGALQTHLKEIMPGGYPDEVLARMASVSIGEVGQFALFLGLAVILFAVILSGALAGRRAKWAGILMGILIAVDLGHANAPWIIYYNYKAKYATNPVIDILRDKPYEHRVTFPRLPLSRSEDFLRMRDQFYGFYFVVWLQHHFPFYNIQSLDIAQEPRAGVDKANFLTALTGTGNPQSYLRYWQLTNTRLQFGFSGNYADQLNSIFDPVQRRFRLHTPFTLTPTSVPNQYDAQITTNGPLALIEFTGALPRAKLYSQWESITNEQAMLARLPDPAFNPERTVLIGKDVPAPAAGVSTNAGTVEFTSYAPKTITLQAKVETPSVLLLNDRYSPDWKAWVDGQPVDVFRANYIMRGITLSPGEHKIEYRFEPSSKGLYVSVAAYLAGFLLCGIVLMGGSARKPDDKPAAHPEPKQAK